MAKPEAKYVISAENRAKQALKEAVDDFNQLGAAARKTESLLKSFGGGLISGFIGSVSLAGIAAITKNFAEQGDQIDRLSKLANVGTDEFQKLAYGAERIGMSHEKLADIFKDTQDKLGDFLQNGAGPLKDFFENIAPRVGVTAEQFRRLSGPQALELYVSSLEKAKLSQSEMTFYMEAIASDSTLLLPLLLNNARGFREIGEAAARAGAVMDTETIRAARDLKDELQRLRIESDALKTSLLSGVVPALVSLSKWLNEARGEGSGFFGALGTWASVSGADERDPIAAMSRIERDIAKLRKMRDELDPEKSFANRLNDWVFGDVGDLDKQIAAQEARLRYVRLLVDTAVQADMTALGGLGPTPTMTPRPRSKPGRPERAPDIFTAEEKRLQSLVERAINDNDITKAQDYATALRRIDTLFFAGLIPSAEEYDAAVRALSKSTETSGAEGERALEGLADKWKDLIDPTRAYTRQLEEIRNLVAAGKLTRGQGIAAEFEVENRRTDEMLGGLADSVLETSDAARELGLTFQSAFEDAAVAGRSFSDVLDGIRQDLIRLSIRKGITEPFEKWGDTHGWNLGAMFGSLFKKAGGIDFVPYDNYPALLHRGERVVPAIEASTGREQSSISYTQNVNVHGEMTRTQEARLLAAMRNVATATVVDMKRRGVVT